MIVNTRKAVIEDLPEILKLFRETIYFTCQKDYSPEQLAAWTSATGNTDRWKNAIVQQYFLIAEIQSQIVGFGSLENEKYIDFLYVHKDYQRKGIAGLIYSELLKESLRTGSRKILTDASKTAKPFFQSKGFKEEKENKKNIQGIEIINYHMAKDL